MGDEFEALLVDAARQVAKVIMAESMMDGHKRNGTIRMRVTRNGHTVDITWERRIGGSIIAATDN